MSQESALPSRLPSPIGDEIERCFRQSDLLSLATRLDAELSGCHGIELDRAANWAVASGTLNLSHDEITTRKTARCEIQLVPDWKSQLPVVRCREVWVRNDWNWHAGNGGVLCYVLDEQWRDFVGEVLDRDGAMAASLFAACLCLRNVRWLLYRHYIASITKLVEWPKDWPAWPHGDIGHKDYLRETRRVEPQ